MQSESAVAQKFKTLCVIQFSSKTAPDAIEWVRKKISAPKDEGGGGLDVVTYVAVQMHTTLHVGASYERLLEAAEDVSMRKTCVDGTLRQFCRSAADRLYENFAFEDAFFTVAEKQRLVLYELENIRALPDETSVPGYPAVRLLAGESIVRRCISKDIIQQIFPLHDAEQVAVFGRVWYNVGSALRLQPIELIRNYFGEKIGLYFAFLGFYTRALTVPAVFAFLYHCFDWGSSLHMKVAMALVSVFWPAVFLKLWRRRSSEMAYRWGTSNIKVTEQPRAAFHGEVGVSPITGKPCLQYPTWKRNLRVCASWLVVAVCLLLAYVSVRLYALANDAALAWRGGLEPGRQQQTLVGLVVALPGIVYSTVVVVANKVYKGVAVRLTDWENHCVQRSYEKHLILKLVLVLFSNTFMVMFYVMFVYLDAKQLQTTLIVQLVVIQIIDQLQETLVPYIVYKWRKSRCKQAGDIYAEYVTSDGKCLPARTQAELEATKAVYEGTFDDYLELFIQFGYVTLFSCVFPLAGVLALLNNLLEIRTDAVKLCKVYQRPFAEQAASIGVWQFVFEAVGVLSVITNCAIIGMSFHTSHSLPTGWDDVWLLFYIMVAEHVILGMKLLLSYVIPDEPRRVAVSLARDEYQSKMAAIELMKQNLIKKSK